MRIDDGKLSFGLNDRELGVAFEDERLKGDEMVPFVFIHEKAAIVEVLEGEINRIKY